MDQHLMRAILETIDNMDINELASIHHPLEIEGFEQDEVREVAQRLDEEGYIKITMEPVEPEGPERAIPVGLRPKGRRKLAEILEEQ